MCGMTKADGSVRLIASQELNRAELEAERELQHDFGWMGPAPFMLPGPLSYRIILTTDMRSCVFIDAPDYPAAFRGLFEQWSPQPAARTGIEGQREITAASGPEEARERT